MHARNFDTSVVTDFVQDYSGVAFLASFVLGSLKLLTIACNAKISKGILGCFTPLPPDYLRLIVV